MATKKVIIIGAGVGGLATSILLAKKGYQVTILEKNKIPGGRCQKFVREGYTFDTGPTMYLFPKMFAEFFASIGENINDYLTLKRADPTYRLHFADGTSLSLTSDIQKMQA